MTHPWTVRQFREVETYGDGSLGGKGAGLVKVNECDIPKVEKLRTRILATDFYDAYLKRGGSFGAEESALFARILTEMGDAPIGVRSSATNEGGESTSGRLAVHAGENMSFMLPNNHPESAARLEQFRLAVQYIYDDFRARRMAEDQERMAIVINPIPGLLDDTLAGPFYYPYISGVANSFFPHALRDQNPREGFARIAFGHGYATVLDDFPVISMATIRNPIPLKYVQIGAGQRYFYALDMTKNKGLRGEELETMKTLHIRFANFHKIRLLGLEGQIITIEELVQNDHFGFKTGLDTIMRRIASDITAHFQIEFVFNIDFSRKPRQDGVFHVVQLTLLPEVTYEPVAIPSDAQHIYLSIRSLQGHGVTKGVGYAVVVSPFVYEPGRHDEVRRNIADINRQMRRDGKKYIIIVPGRLGTKNRDWGIDVDYADINQAAGIFEYGVDIAGRAEPLPEKDSLTGGIYGSHFLYMIHGGYSEEQRQLYTRMYGTQGTHFFTNIMTTNTCYGFISPVRDLIDPWLFSQAGTGGIPNVLAFPKPVALYADSLSQRCVVIAERE